MQTTRYELYRLAGLLHDVGHYPFSHTFEDAVSTYYQDRFQPDLFTYADQSSQAETGPHISETHDQIFTSLDHEDVGRRLLRRDPEITAVLASYDINPADIDRIFSRQPSDDGKIPRFANLTQLRLGCRPYRLSVANCKAHWPTLRIGRHRVFA